MASSRIIVCRHCGETRRHGSFEMCQTCYVRWDRAGRPDTGPPPPQGTEAARAAAREANTAARRGRIEDYQDLRSWGLTREAAAQRLGVTVRTAWDYEASLKSMAGAS